MFMMPNAFLATRQPMERKYEGSILSALCKKFFGFHADPMAQELKAVVHPP